MTIEWTNEWSVGVDELDQHHQYMMSLINTFGDATGGKEPPANVMEVFDELIAYASYHFGSEEALFTATGYPDAEYHIQEHLAYREQMGKLKNLVMKRDPAAARQIIEFLVSWWPGHISVWDRGYADYLK